MNNSELGLELQGKEDSSSENFWATGGQLGPRMGNKRTSNAVLSTAISN